MIKTEANTTIEPAVLAKFERFSKTAVGRDHREFYTDVTRDLWSIKRVKDDVRVPCTGCKTCYYELKVRENRAVYTLHACDDYKQFLQAKGTATYIEYEVHTGRSYAIESRSQGHTLVPTRFVIILDGIARNHFACLKWLYAVIIGIVIAFCGQSTSNWVTSIVAQHRVFDTTTFATIASLITDAHVRLNTTRMYVEMPHVAGNLTNVISTLNASEACVDRTVSLNASCHASVESRRQEAINSCSLREASKSNCIHVAQEVMRLSAAGCNEDSDLEIAACTQKYAVIQEHQMLEVANEDAVHTQQKADVYQQDVERIAIVKDAVAVPGSRPFLNWLYRVVWHDIIMSGNVTGVVSKLVEQAITFTADILRAELEVLEQKYNKVRSEIELKYYEHACLPRDRCVIFGNSVAKQVGRSINSLVVEAACKRDAPSYCDSSDYNDRRHSMTEKITSCANAVLSATNTVAALTVQFKTAIARLSELGILS